MNPNALPPQIATMPKDEASKLFAGVGEYYMDRDDSDRAIDFFRESLTLSESNSIAKSGLSEALALKGNALLADDSQDVARKFFEEALSYNERNAPAYYGLAEVMSEEGDEDGDNAQPDHGHDRNQGVLQGVHRNNMALAQALGAGGAQVVLPRHLQHAGPGQPN